MKQWLNKQLERAQESAQSDATSELCNWIERVEKFNQDWFVKFENILHNANVGPMWMQDERVAAKVAESLSQLDGKAYRLDAYSIMSNFDHVIRRGKFDKTVRYVLNNPVKAGLAKHWRDWRWNYCREQLRDRF